MESPEENFEELRKLLELKRHETPPPGYFEGFSSNLIARIEAEDARPTPAWWQRFFPSLDASPLMVGAYGVIVASLVIAGVQLAGQAGSPEELAPNPGLAGTEPVGLEVESNAMIVTASDEAEGVARTAPTGMFNPPSIHGTSTPQRVSFPVK